MELNVILYFFTLKLFLKIYNTHYYIFSKRKYVGITIFSAYLSKNNGIRYDLYCIVNVAQPEFYDCILYGHEYVRALSNIIKLSIFKQ